MASIKRRNRYYYIRFVQYDNGKRMERTLALGTRWKEIALKHKATLEKLEDSGLIDPFHPDFDIDQALFQSKDHRVFNLKDAAKNFVDSKKHLRNTTVDFYERNLNHWMDHRQIHDLHPAKISISEVKEFLFRGGIKPASIHANARAIRAFFNYLINENIVKSNPIDVIKLPENDVNYRSKMLTEDELSSLFKAFDEYQAKISPEPWYRQHHRQDWFKPLMATYFYTGMRLHEAAYSPKIDYSGLKGANILDDCTVFEMGSGKGIKKRFIPISKHLRPLILHYFERRGIPGPNEFVFIHQGGRYDGEPVRGRAARVAFNDYCDKAGLGTDKTMHGLRHQRVTKWIEDGFSVKEASMMAGHSSTAVTEGIYTHLEFEKLREKMKRLEDE